VFSETFVPGYPYWRGVQPISRLSDLMVEYQKNSLKIPSDDTEALCDAARDSDIVVALGHYARWDVLRLDLRGEPSDPLTGRRPFLDPSRLRKMAEKHGVEPEKLEAMLEDLGII